MCSLSWEKEFYPVEANEIKGAKNRVEHALQKWRGALPKNLKKHGVTFKDHTLLYKYDPSVYESRPVLTFDSASCALCVKYIDEADQCPKCPITKLTGEYCVRDYCASVNNPKPMIVLLEEVLEKMP